MVNSVDPDQMPHSVASDLSLHCLLRPVCPTNKGYYGIPLDSLQILYFQHPLERCFSLGILFVIDNILPGTIYLLFLCLCFVFKYFLYDLFYG